VALVGNRPPQQLRLGEGDWPRSPVLAPAFTRPAPRARRQRGTGLPWQNQSNAANLLVNVPSGGAAAAACAADKSRAATLLSSCSLLSKYIYLLHMKSTTVFFPAFGRCVGRRPRAALQALDATPAAAPTPSTSWSRPSAQ